MYVIRVHFIKQNKTKQYKECGIRFRYEIIVVTIRDLTNT